jgi:hypothetical protein
MTLSPSIIEILIFYIKRGVNTKNLIINVLLQLYISKVYNLELIPTSVSKDFKIIFSDDKNSCINLIKEKFNYSMLKIDEDDFIELHTILINCKNITFENPLNDIINYFINNKELTNHYKNLSDYISNNLITDYMIKLANPKLEKIANVCSGTGNLFINTANHFKASNQSLNLLKNMYGFEIDDEIKLCSLLNVYISTNIMLNDNILTTDILHDNIFNESYDLVISDFPVGIRNIIHANCCNKIKSLKIRGTKSEPLILQLIMNSLNKNGRAILNVPDNLLYNESKQHIETRRYLFDNFSINKVVSVDKHLQTIKGNKTSIIYLERKGKTNEVQFSKISLKDDKLVEKKIVTIKQDLIQKNNYILWNEKYIEIDENKVSINTMKLSELVDIIYESDINDEVTKVLSENYLVFPNYINDTKKVHIDFGELKLKKDTFTLFVKDQSLCLQKYLNYYISQTIQKNILLYTSGKLNKIDIDKLFEMKIKIPSMKTQTTITNFFDLNNTLIEANNEQITRYTEMKEKFINLFNDKFDKIKIKDICNIDSKPSKVNTIMIQRNSNAVGTVSLSTEDSIETTNIYYLNNIKKDFNEKCLYHVLKNNEEQFFKLANLTSTVNLNRTNLENFEIQIYTEDVQEKIVTQCDLYDRICNDLSEMNGTIMIKNIINEITKLEKDIANKQNKLV